MEQQSTSSQQPQKPESSEQPLQPQVLSQSSASVPASAPEQAQAPAETKSQDAQVQSQTEQQSQSQTQSQPQSQPQATPKRPKRQMGLQEVIERNCLFLFAVFLGGLGIALVTSANIGTTPISSPNYVVSLHTPLSLGAMTFIFNTLLVVLQIFIVGKQYARDHALIIFLQIPVTLIFSAAIDISMHVIGLIVPSDVPYILSLCLLAAGSITLAISVTLQVCADVSMVSGEAFVKAISQRLHKEFGLVKTCFDSSLVLIAVIISFVWTGFSAVEGVREGTVVGALSIGPMVRLLLPRVQPKLSKFFNRHHPKDAQGYVVAGAGANAGVEQGAGAATVAQGAAQTLFPVITITRQYGCGGRKLGRQIAEELGIKFYDNELIAIIAQESGLSPHVVEKSEGRLDNALLYQMVMKDFAVPLEKSMSTSDALFVATSRAVRQVAHTSPCVIVGRGADRILEDNPYCIRVLLYSDLEHKLAICKQDYGQEKEQALDTMRSQDRSRAEYYRQYFGKDLLDPQNYQLCLNVGALGPERCRALIKELYQAQAAAATAAAQAATAAAASPAKEAAA